MLENKILKILKTKVSFLTIFLALSFLVLLFLVWIIQAKFNLTGSKTIQPTPTLNTNQFINESIPQPTKPASAAAEKTVVTYIPQTYGRQVRVPILTYHYISDNPNPADLARNNLAVSPAKFEEQMKYLAESGYNTISLDTLYPALKGQTSLPSKPVILTFDDGYMDFYSIAYPILRQYNLHATVFIPTSLMNQGYYLTWAQIREMSNSGLITFGAHSVHHYNLPSVSAQTLEYELAESRKVLQDNLGMPINFMAYPNGATNDQVIGFVKKAGYLGAVGTWPNKIQSEGTIYNLPRLKVGGGANLQTFISLL